MEPMVNVALRAAWEAENLVNRMIDRPDLIKVTRGKSRRYVTNLEHSVEDTILAALRQAYPQHGYYTPEIGMMGNPEPEFLWRIDPLCGTENLIRGLPHFAFTIACLHRGRTEHAVIVDPIRRERFTASRGKGAQLGDSRIRVTGRTSLADAAIAFAPRAHGDAAALAPESRRATRIRQEGVLLRESGCTALDLAYVAAGRLDAACMTGVEANDVEAGVLVVTEAGGLVSDFAGGAAYRDSGEVVVASPKCLKPLLQLLHSKT